MSLHEFWKQLFAFITWLYVYCECRCVIDVEPSDNITLSCELANTNQCNVHIMGIHKITEKIFCTLYGDPWNPIEIYGDGVNETGLHGQPNFLSHLFNIMGSYFIVRDIEIEGGKIGILLGQTGDVSYAQFINLKIHNTSSNGFRSYTDYTTSSREYKYITIRNVEIYDTSGNSGSCFSFGDTSGSSVYHHNIIESNYCHDTFSTSGTGYGDGIWLGLGSHSNMIRDNVILNTYGPGMQIFDSCDDGNNIIERNIVLNAGNVGVQIVAGVEVYNNIIHSGSHHAFKGHGTSQLCSGEYPRNIIVNGNTIVSSDPSYYGDNCFEGMNWHVHPDTITIINNLILCGDEEVFVNERALLFWPSHNVDALTFENNAIYGTDNMNSYPSSNFKLSISENIQDLQNHNYYPTPSSDLIYFSNFTSIKMQDIDIDCVDRNDWAYIGAYQYIFNRSQPLFYVNNDFNFTEKGFKNTCYFDSTSFPTTAMPVLSTTLSPTQFPEPLASENEVPQQFTSTNMLEEITQKPETTSISSAVYIIICIGGFVIAVLIAGIIYVIGKKTCKQRDNERDNQRIAGEDSDAEPDHIEGIHVLLTPN